METVRQHLLRAFPFHDHMSTTALAEMAVHVILAARAAEMVKLSTADRLPPELEEVVDRAATQDDYGWRRGRPQRKTEE